MDPFVQVGPDVVAIVRQYCESTPAIRAGVGEEFRTLIGADGCQRTEGGIHGQGREPFGGPLPVDGIQNAIFQRSDAVIGNVVNRMA